MFTFIENRQGIVPGKFPKLINIQWATWSRPQPFWVKNRVTLHFTMHGPPNWQVFELLILGRHKY